MASVRLLVGLLVVAASLPALGEPPTLRYTTYLMVAVAGEPTQVALESRPYGTLHDDYTYKEQPTYAVIGADGQLIEEIDGKLGQRSTATVPASAGAFALIEARPGNNYCLAHPQGPHGFVATQTAPLNVVRGFERLHFFVPRGLTAASVFVHAWSLKEAARVLIYDPDGKAAAEQEDDFNEPTALSFLVPPGQDGRCWSLALLPPRNPEWTIDDCKVWLSASLPGVLAPEPEWAEHLARPFVVEWRALFDFEGESPLQYVQWDQPPQEGAELPAFEVAQSPDQPHTGKQSLRVEMRLPDQVTRPTQLKIFTNFVEAGPLARVKFWLYGDASGRAITVRVRDQNMEHHYCPAGTINWSGWGEVTADFAKATSIAGGDENKQIDGPKVSVVIQIGHQQGQPTASVYYLDDLAVSP